MVPDGARRTPALQALIAAFAIAAAFIFVVAAVSLQTGAQTAHAEACGASCAVVSPRAAPSHQEEGINFQPEQSLKQEEEVRIRERRAKFSG